MFYIQQIVYNPNFIKLGPLEIGAKSLFRIEMINDEKTHAVLTPMASPYVKLETVKGYEIGDVGLPLKHLRPYFSGTIGAIMADVLRLSYNIGEQGTGTINFEELETILQMHINKEENNDSSFV